LQMFCAINECDNDSIKWCFLPKYDGYQKMCDTNKNVTKMGVIIKGIYFITHNLNFFRFFDKYQCEYIFEYLRII
jgi:hypothetical protein